MRYLVISDIHANLEAFETVLAEAKPLEHDKVLLLGDLVGYGGDPNAICERVRAMQPDALIRGNHDKVGPGVESPEGFNAVARSAIKWTYETLTRENREWLAALPAGPMIVDDLDALRAMHAARRPLCLFGHTHVQVGHYLSRDQFGLATQDDQRPLTIKLDTTNRYLVNPGSVGQPRDGDPRAGFGIVDTTAMEMTIYRVEYPIAKAQARILEQGLPDVLAQRLALGR